MTSEPKSIGRKEVGRHGIVQDQREPLPVRDPGELLDVGNIELGVADRFGVERLRLRADRLAERLRITRFYKADVYTHARKCIMKEVVSSAVEIISRNDLVSRPCDVEYGKGDRGLPARRRQGAGSAIQQSHPFLQYVRRRVHQARIDISSLCEGKEICRMLRTLELIGSRLVNGNSPGTRRGIRLLSSVEQQGLNLQLVIDLGHRNPPYSRSRGPILSAATWFILPPGQTRRGSDYKRFPGKIHRFVKKASSYEAVCTILSMLPLALFMIFSGTSTW